MGEYCTLRQQKGAHSLYHTTLQKKVENSLKQEE